MSIFECVSIDIGAETAVVKTPFSTLNVCYQKIEDQNLFSVRIIGISVMLYDDVIVETSMSEYNKYTQQGIVKAIAGAILAG